MSVAMLLIALAFGGAAAVAAPEFFFDHVHAAPVEVVLQFFALLP